MKLYLARHGRTNYNERDLCNSDPSVDVHLTAEGIEQAKALAAKLRDVNFEQVYASELRRTQQTARYVIDSHRAPVALTVSPLLNDHRSGFEGQPASQLLAAMAGADNRWTAAFNGGESVEDMKRRVSQFLTELKTTPSSGVLVVTSGWVIFAAVAAIQAIPNEEAWELDLIQGDYLELEL